MGARSKHRRSQHIVDSAVSARRNDCRRLSCEELIRLIRPLAPPCCDASRAAELAAKAKYPRRVRTQLGSEGGESKSAERGE